MNTGYLTGIYAIYTATAIGLTAWLAHTLSANGRVFLRDVFPDRHDLADAVNRLLVVGFYMLNLGYAFLIFRTDRRPKESIDATEMLITKLGVLLVSLGVIHFINMFIFWKMRKSTQPISSLPPIAPSMMVSPPPTY